MAVPLADVACAPEPTATDEAPLATACGPTATASVPPAVASGNAELTRKYLMPPPLTALLTVLRLSFTEPSAPPTLS
jgi:hypothetical protein